MVQSGLGRLFWKQEIGGSNPLFPTMNNSMNIEREENGNIVITISLPKDQNFSIKHLGQGLDDGYILTVFPIKTKVN